MPILSSAKVSRGSLRPSQATPRDTSADKRTIGFLVQSKSSPPPTPEPTLRSELEALRAEIAGLREEAAVSNSANPEEGWVEVSADPMPGTLVALGPESLRLAEPPRLWDLVTVPWRSELSQPSFLRGFTGAGYLAEKPYGRKAYPHHAHVMELKYCTFDQLGTVPDYGAHGVTEQIEKMASRVARVRVRGRPPQKGR